MQESKIALEDIQKSLEMPANIWKEWIKIRRIVSHEYLLENISYEVFRTAQDLAHDAYYLRKFPFENSEWGHLRTLY
jgi:hypothetical protein